MNHYGCILSVSVNVGNVRTSVCIYVCAYVVVMQSVVDGDVAVFRTAAATLVWNFHLHPLLSYAAP